MLSKILDIFCRHYTQSNKPSLPAGLTWPMLGLAASDTTDSASGRSLAICE